MPWEEAAQQKMPWDEARENASPGMPDPTNPAAAIRDPKQDVMTYRGYRQRTAASPYAPAGQAEEAMGEGMTNKEQLQEGGNNLLRAGVATAGGVLGAPIAAEAFPAVGPTIARTLARHPVATRVGASAAIGAARRIPYVGHLIPSGAELVPLLMGSGGTPEGEVVPPEPGETPQFPAPRPLPPSSSDRLLPEEPGRVISMRPEPGSREDILETRGIQEQMREAAEAQDRVRLSQARREWFGRNQPGATKGELTGAPERPVTYSRTPGVRIAGPRPGTIVPAPDEDLTDLLRKSVMRAKRPAALPRQ
jgi:hypothetical protein